MGTLADAYVRVRPTTDGVEDELVDGTRGPASRAGDQAGHHFGRTFGRALKTAVAGLAIGAVLLAGVGGKFLKSAIDDASDLNETISKSQQIFPKSQAAMQRFGDTAATALGLSKQQALEGASSFGNFFNQIGIGEKLSAKMSTRLIQLSSDLASFNNADPAKVMDSFLSATRGEYDSLQQFIPTINAATVQTEALRLSHKKSVKDLTDADKAQALYSIALRDAGKAQGDFARTSDGAANQQRILKASLTNLRTEIGTGLLPVWGRFLAQINGKVIPALTALWREHGPQVTAFLSGLGDRIVTLIGQVASADWAGIFGGLKDFFNGLKETAGPALQQIRENAKPLGDAFRNDIIPALKEARESGGSQLADALKVTGTVMAFLGSHIDLLAKALPILVAGFIAYKTAQAAANAAALLAIPTKIAEVVVNRQLVASNRALIASRVGLTTQTEIATVATVANTGAENVGVLTRARSVVGMVAQRVAMVAVRAATIAWAAVQWLLNAALTANPIGLIIVAIAAFVAGIIYAYTHVEWFRRFVDGAFTGAKVVISAVVGWIVGTAWPWLQSAWDGIIAGVQWVQRFVRGAFLGVKTVVDTVVGWVVGFVQSRIAAVIAIVHGIGRIVDIAKQAFQRVNAAIAEKLGTAVAWVKALPGRFVAALSNLGSALYSKGRDLIEGFINGIKAMAGRVADALISLLPGPLKKFASMLGLASPSKLFHRYGVWTVQGYVSGIDSEAGSVDAAIARIAPGGPRGAGGGFAFDDGAASRRGGPGGGGADGPMRLHPRDIAELGRVIGQVMAAGIGAANQVNGRRANILQRGGG